MATRQTHDKTFKQEAVRLVQTSGKSQRQIADDLGVGMSTLSRQQRTERGPLSGVETSSQKQTRCAAYVGKMIFYVRNATSSKKRWPSSRIHRRPFPLY
jgi:transposase-like protein